MSKFSCTSPRVLRVMPTGSRKKKDGSDGKAVLMLHDGAPVNRFEVENHFEDSFVIDDDTGEVSSTYQVPCGKCFNCRMRRKFEWSTRCIMESKQYDSDHQICVALTYDSLKILPSELREMLTDDGQLSLVYKHFQRFLDSLRKKLKETGFNGTIRYFVCGEYGDQLARPHFHALLFGYDFWMGAKFSHYSDTGIPLFTNPLLDEAWYRGMAEFQAVAPENIRYICGYVTKKLSDNRDYGLRTPPFVHMSLSSGGIGRQYVLDHYQQILDSGGIYVDGNKIGVPRPFLNALAKETPVSVADLARLRSQNCEAADLRESSEMARHGYDLLKYRTALSTAEERAFDKNQKLMKGGL